MSSSIQTFSSGNKLSQLLQRVLTRRRLRKIRKRKLFLRMNAPNLGRRLTYLLGVVVAYSLWKWYTLSDDWKKGSRSLSDSDDSVFVYLCS